MFLSGLKDEKIKSPAERVPEAASDRIVEDVLRRLRGGELKPGDRLPTEQELGAGVRGQPHGGARGLAAAQGEGRGALARGQRLLHSGGRAGAFERLAAALFPTGRIHRRIGRNCWNSAARGNRKRAPAGGHGQSGGFRPGLGGGGNNAALDRRSSRPSPRPMSPSTRPLWRRPATVCLPACTGALCR